LSDVVDRRETELVGLVACGRCCDSADDDDNSFSSKENEDDCSIISSMTELNLHETGAGGTADGGHVRTDQFPLLLCVQQQSNKCCLRSPVHESHCLNYSNCDVFDCTLDSEHNDLLTCPFGFSYRPKSNQLFDSMSPVLFNDM